MKRAFALLVALATPALAVAQSTWMLEPNHTQASFTVRHMVISNVRGEFGKIAGTVTLDDRDVTKSAVAVTIETASLDTRVADRDKHLRSAEFFDVERYPTMTFRSTKIEKAGEGNLRVTGDLTIKGVTKPVVLDVDGPTPEIKDPRGNARRGLSASTRINRRDFGLMYSKVVEAGPVVGDEVKIEIEAELVKQPEKQAVR